MATFLTGEAMLKELGRTHELVKKQRIRIEKAAKAHAAKAKKGEADSNHLPRDITLALEKLVKMEKELSGELRQLMKLLNARQFTDAEAFQTLIDAGWTPPNRKAA